MPYALPALLIAARPDALAREQRRCTGKLTLTGDGVGALRVGASAAAVKKVCRIPRVRLKRGEAPPPENQLDFHIGKVPIQAELQDGRVWRIVIDGEALKTADKLGVGSPLAAVLASGQARAGEREGVIYATTSRHCGISFEVGYTPRRGEDRDEWTADALALLPKDTKVTRVLLNGCVR